VHLKQSKAKKRESVLEQVWNKDRDLKSKGFDFSNKEVKTALENFSNRIDATSKVSDLLQIKAQLTKRLYKITANRTGHGDFAREREAKDTVNAFLNHGNYLQADESRKQVLKETGKVASSDKWMWVVRSR
jgi:CRISP-associated protein Cas1